MKERINNLQALRAFAALMVAYIHTEFVFWKFGMFGGFGVPVFFVISGFIIADVCATDPGDFLKRRIIRIIPLYWMFTLALFVVAVKFPQVLVATRANSSELLKSLLFVPFRKSNGHIIPMLFVGWTLNFEMVFYGIVSLCLLFSKKATIPFTIAAIFIIQIVLGWGVAESSVLKFYAGPLMLDFAAGMGAYYLYLCTSGAVCFRYRGVFMFFAAASFTSLAILEGWYRFNVHNIRYCLPSFLLVLSVVLLSKSGLDTKSRILILIGDASYALYLSHPFVVDMIRRVLARAGFDFLRNDKVSGMLISVLASVLVGVGVHLWIEKPLIRYLSRRFLSRVRATPKLESLATPVSTITQPS